MESRRTARTRVMLFALASVAMGCAEERAEQGADALATAEAAADVRARREVREALEAYYADFSARDWEAFAGHFWPGADITTVFAPPDEEETRVVVTPVEGFIAQAPTGPGSREIFEERMLESDVKISGHLAQAWVRYAARFGDPGDVAEWEGIDAFTLMRHEGVWKITSLAFAADDP